MSKKELDLEIVNHSYYKANNTVQIKKYISENQTLILPLIIRALKGDRTLLLAPTGSGKTYSIIDNLKRHKIKSIFIVPNAFNVEQIQKEYEIKGAWGDISINAIMDEEIICVTWDKFIQIDKEILKEYIVILDEVHQTAIDTFRMSKINKLYESLEYTKGQVHITATPNKLNFNQYDYILEYKQSIQTNYNVCLYDKIDDLKILEIIKNSKKFALFKDDKRYLDFIKDNMFNKKIDVITSDTRDFSDTYKTIVESSTISEVDGICNTRVLTAGVNIHDMEITDIIIIGEKDIATIKQYVARFRDLKQVNIHIFNNYVEEESKVYEIEWLIDKKKQEVENFLNYFNGYNYGNFTEEYLDLKPFRLENRNEYYYSNEQNKYKLNDIGIRNQCYTNYYSKADIESFKVLLGEYFSDIKIEKIENPNTNATRVYNEITKLEKEKALNILSKNKNELVGAIPIITNNNITKDLKDYLKQNNLDIETQREKLLELDVLKYLKVANISKIINLYTKYVTKDCLTYNMAWSIATRGNRSRGKIFAQINYVAYQDISKKYENHINYHTPESMLTRQIKKYFEIGKSYTKEHLEIFIEAYKNVNPFSLLTLSELREKLNIMFVIEKKRPRSGQVVDNNFLFNMMPTTRPEKRPVIYTIVDNTSVDSIVKQNNWSEIDKQILKRNIKEIIKNATLKVENLEFGLNLFA